LTANALNISSIVDFAHGSPHTTKFHRLPLARILAHCSMHARPAGAGNCLSARAGYNPNRREPLSMLQASMLQA
jgi:hypothetical protein